MAIVTSSAVTIFDLMRAFVSVQWSSTLTGSNFGSDPPEHSLTRHTPGFTVQLKT